MDPVKLKAALAQIVARARKDAPIVVPVLLHALEAVEATTTDPVARILIAVVVAELESLLPNPPAPAA